MMENILYFVFFAGLFAFMMRFGCGVHVMGHHGKNDDVSSNEQGETPANMSRNQTSQQTDPVCGMSVDPAQAKSAVYRGHAYYFCSPACREKFEVAPSSFIKSGITGATA